MHTFDAHMVLFLALKCKTVSEHLLQTPTHIFKLCSDEWGQSRTKNSSKQITNLEKAVQEECEPVGEHLLSHRFSSAKKNKYKWTLCFAVLRVF